MISVCILYSILIILYSMIFMIVNSFQYRVPPCISIKRWYSRSIMKMMPEGPEVRSMIDDIENSFFSHPSTSSSDSFSAIASRWQLTDVNILSGRYSTIKPENYDHLIEKLPIQFHSINSKGKFIYFDCGDVFIWSTLGLTGQWIVTTGERILIPSDKNEKNDNHSNSNIDNETTNHLRMIWNFREIESKMQKSLVYYDQIGYGTIKISNKEELEKKLQMIGPCWVTNPISFEDFFELVKKIKSDRSLAVFLMDQKKTSGIGNYMLSEILYISCIHPWAQCKDLSKDHVKKLYDAITLVTQASYHSQSPKHRSKQTISNKSTFEFQVYMRQVCVLGYPVKRQIGPHKRGIHWVPDIQVICTPIDLLIP